MRLSSAMRRSIGEACHALGILWAGAGMLKLVFGVRISFPLFPPVDLSRVSPLPSLGVALALVTVGAWFRRSAKFREEAEVLSLALAAEDQAQLALGERAPTSVIPPMRESHPASRPGAG